MACRVCSKASDGRIAVSLRYDTASCPQSTLTLQVGFSYATDLHEELAVPDPDMWWSAALLNVLALRDVLEEPTRPGAKARPDLAPDAFVYHLMFSRQRVAGERVKAPRHFVLYRHTDEKLSLPACSTTTAILPGIFRRWFGTSNELNGASVARPDSHQYQSRCSY